MATPEQIVEVRGKANEKASETYSDEYIAVLIDFEQGNTNLAAARIWRLKAAAYADLVDTSEAGASRKLSDLSKAAAVQAGFYETEGGKEVVVPHARVHVIKRVS